MKKKKNELKDESIKGLQSVVLNLRKEIFALRNELAFNQKLEKPHQLKQKRKEMARALTFLTLKEKAAAKGV